MTNIWQEVAAKGLVLLGGGKMGTALAAGWIAGGLPAKAVHVIEPQPSTKLQALGAYLNAPLPTAPALVVLAVKPQMMAAALPQVAGLAAQGAVFLSIAAGLRLGFYENLLGSSVPILRAMPNTPAAVGRGISALIGNGAASPKAWDLAEAALSAVGAVVRLVDEGQMDAVTAVSGSGPAYVFHLIEALAAAAEAEGLPAGLAQRLARETIIGAAELARLSPESPGQLRQDVTSPGGTTAAGLAVLMPELTDLMTRTVQAAAVRGRALGQ